MNKVLFALAFSLLFSMSSVMADVSPETVVNIFERLETLEKKTRELHGKNEELQHQILQLKKQQKQSFLAVDERIEEMSNATKDGVKATSKKTADTNKDEPRVKIVDRKPEAPKSPPKPTPVKKDEAPVKTPKPQAELDTPKKEDSKTAQADKTKKSRAPTTYEKEVYQSAFNLMKKSPTAASRAFAEYIKMQPNSPLAANAQYWIGEIMYSHNNYKGAVQEFIKVLQKYKFSDKAPDAAIKLGYSFYALKNWAYARRTFEDVLKYFPKNKNAINLANRRLAKMKAAGH